MVKFVTWVCAINWRVRGWQDMQSEISYLPSGFSHNSLIRYMHRPVISGHGLYDPTTIMNASELNRAMKEGWCKLGFYILSFFYHLYRYSSQRGMILRRAGPGP